MGPDEVSLRLGAGGIEGESVETASPEEPAGLWRRGVALVVDALVVGVLLQTGSLLGRPLARWELVQRAFTTTVEIVVPAAYFVLFHGTGGQTLGKRLVGVRVVGRRGEPIGYLRALGRVLALALATLPLGLGLAVAVVRRDRRGLHDLLAGTRVARAG